MTTRIRSRSNLVALPALNQSLAKDGTVFSTTVLSGQWGSGKSETMSDVSTPRFQTRRARGEIINSPMSRTVYTYAPPTRKTSHWIWVEKNPSWSPTMNVGFTCNDPIALRFGRLGFPDGRLPPWNAPLAAQAIARARSGAGSPDVQLMVTIGEARETARLISGAVNLLLERTKPFKVLRRRYEQGKLNYRDFLAEAANLDLLVRYGVMPLLYDIQGFVKAFTTPRKPDRRTSRATESDSGSSNWITDAASSMYSNITLSHSLTWTRDYRATVLYESVDDLQARMGLRPADVPSAAWELTRLSFVADWFVNMSDFIGSITLAARGNVVLQCVVESLTAQYTALYTESGPLSDEAKTSTCISNGSGSKVDIVCTRKTRSPYNTADIGILTPRVKLNTQRIVDGLSLLATTMDISNRRNRLVRI